VGFLARRGLRGGDRVAAVFERFAVGAVDFAFGVGEALFRGRFAGVVAADPILVVADGVLGFAQFALDPGARADAAFGEVAVGEDVPTDDDRVPLRLRDGRRDGGGGQAERRDEDGDGGAGLGGAGLDVVISGASLGGVCL
jgi:hypothetical protein